MLRSHHKKMISASYLHFNLYHFFFLEVHLFVSIKKREKIPEWFFFPETIVMTFSHEKLFHSTNLSFYNSNINTYSEKKVLFFFSFPLISKSFTPCWQYYPLSKEEKNGFVLAEAFSTSDKWYKLFHVRCFEIYSRSEDPWSVFSVTLLKKIKDYFSEMIAASTDSQNEDFIFLTQ